jgi:hypothetical protein
VRTTVTAPRPPRAAPFPDEPGPIAIANPTAFDIFAFYKLARAHAEKLGGKTVRLSAMRVGGIDRRGLIDLRADPSELIFASPERKKADQDCYLIYELEKGTARFGIGHGSETDTCTSGVPPPRCTAAELWERAATMGLPATAERAVLNRLGRYWQFTSGEWSESIRDDCGQP